MKAQFMANDVHEVTVVFGVTCNITVRDFRNNTVFTGDLSFSQYNEAVDFIKEYDHIYVISMLNKKYGS